LSQSFKTVRGIWPNLLVISYILLGWPLGLWMLARPEIFLNAVGVLLTAHTLIYSAYLIHDCAHHAVFATAAANDRLGVLMSWLNGACLADYARLKKKHLRHHSDRLDTVTFDYRAALRSTPRWVRRGVPNASAFSYYQRCGWRSSRSSLGFR
jgi:fatty acid desaturase